MMNKQNLLVTLASVGLIAGCYTLPEQPNNKRPNIDDPTQQVPEDPNYDPATDPDPDPNVDPNQDPMQNPDPDPMQNPDPMPNPDPNDPLVAAMAQFNADVRPILMMKCSASVCHGGTDVSPIKFCPDNADDYYTTVTGYEAQLLGYFDKNTAPIIHKIVPGPHNSVSFGAQGQAKIEAWLDAEYAARQTGMNPPTTPPTGGNSPGQISERLLQEWSGCMNLTDWTTAGVAQAWADKGSGEGPCIRCHINGQASMIATDESDRMFNVITTSRYFMSTYFAPNVIDPNNARMEINRPEFERVGTNQYPHIEHPSFNVDGNAMTKLTDFYNLTVARVAAGTCDPPRLPPL